MEKKLKNILVDLLKIDSSTNSAQIEKKNIDNWDSVSQLKIILTIEKEFNVKIENNIAFTLLSYDLLKNYILNKSK